MSRQVPAFHVVRSASLAFVLVLALSLSSFVPAPVHAAAFGCRTDPLVVLSNGIVVRISVLISAEPADVESINYTLHVPAGVSVINITYMGIAALGIPETLTVIPDNVPNRYTTETVVGVSAGVTVTATTRIQNTAVTVNGSGGSVLTAVLDKAAPSN